MIGVTLSSPGFETLAEEARKRFQKHTGLQCFVVHTTKDHNYLAKLELANFFEQTVVWFDADLWFIQDCDLSCFDDREEFFAVRDPGIYDTSHFPHHDSKVLDIDVEKYFNTGFYIWNSRHNHVFAEAAKIMVENGRKRIDLNGKLEDFGEQSSINAAVQRHSKLELLSNSFNYMPFAEVHKLQAMEVMRNPLTIHAAGYGNGEPDFEAGTDKLSALRYFETLYTHGFGHEGFNHHTSAKS